MSVQNPSLRSLSSIGAPSAPLQHTLHAAAWRIRSLRLLRYLSMALCYSALVCMVVVGLSKLRLYETPSPWLVVALIALGLVIGALYALVPRLTDLDVARLTERRADLKERLSSAVEFQSLGIGAGEPFYGEQLADANRHAESVNLRALYPARLPRPLPVGLLACLAVFLIYFLPGLPLFWSKERKAEAAEVKAWGAQIVKLALDTHKAADQQKLSETKKAAEEVRKLGEAMRKGKMEKKAAMLAQLKLTRKLEEQQRKLADRMPPKSLEEASKQLKKSMDQMQKEAEQAQKQKQMQQIAQPHNLQKPGQKAQQEQQKESEAMKQAKAAMQQMQQAMAQQNPQAMQQAMEKMAQALQQGGLTKKEMQQMAQAMQQMAQALQNTQMNMSSQQLAQLAQMMQGMNAMDAQSMQQMAAMMRQIGQGMGKASGMARAALDANMLRDLIAAFKEGRMTMAMGNRPGIGPGHGNKGWGGTGIPSKPMKDPGKTNPRLQVASGEHKTNALGKNGSLAEFQKYLMQQSKGPRVQPNGQIKGTRSQNGQELSQSMTGDPSPTQSNSPYYQAVETSRKQAESALNKENIPAAMKKQVKDYFDSIKP